MPSTFTLAISSIELMKLRTLFKPHRGIFFMNVIHGFWEERHKLEPLPHLLWAGKGHVAVIDDLLLVCGAA